MKAQELIRKIKALREAFGEEESQEFIDRLLSGQDIEYESPQELKELYGLVGEKSPVKEDYKAYVGLKQKPSKFTSRELQKLYEEQLLSDPLYRVQRLEERIAKLEEKIARLTALLEGKPEEEEPEEEEEEPEEENEKKLEEELWKGAEREPEVVWKEESGKEEEVEENAENLPFSFSPYGIAEEEENSVGFPSTVEEVVEEVIERTGEALQYQEYQTKEKEEERPLSVEDFSSVGQEERKNTDLEETTLPEVFIPTTESQAEEKQEKKTVPALTIMSLLNLTGFILKRVL